MGLKLEVNMFSLFWKLFNSEMLFSCYQGRSCGRVVLPACEGGEGGPGLTRALGEGSRLLPCLASSSTQD